MLGGRYGIAARHGTDYDSVGSDRGQVDTNRSAAFDAAEPKVGARRENPFGQWGHRSHADLDARQHLDQLLLATRGLGDLCDRPEWDLRPREGELAELQVRELNADSVDQQGGEDKVEAGGQDKGHERAPEVGATGKLRLRSAARSPSRTTSVSAQLPRNGKTLR